MGRDAGYMPEGTEGWMEEDGVPRSYDRPKGRLTLDDMRGQHVHYDGDTGELSVPKLDPPPPRPAEPAELAAAHIKGIIDKTRDIDDVEARFRTFEAALTDAFRRIKALEERLVDPSA